MYISIPCDILDFYSGLFIKCVEMPQYWEVPSPCLMIDWARVSIIGIRYCKMWLYFKKYIIRNAHAMYMYQCDCTFEVLGFFFSLEMGYLLLWFDYYRNFLLLQMYLEFSKIRKWIICSIGIYSSDSFFTKIQYRPLKFCIDLYINLKKKNDFKSADYIYLLLI